MEQEQCTAICTYQLWCNYICESFRKLAIVYSNTFRSLCNEPNNCSASFILVYPHAIILLSKDVYKFINMDKGLLCMDNVLLAMYYEYKYIIDITTA